LLVVRVVAVVTVHGVAAAVVLADTVNLQRSYSMLEQPTQ
jgi:hypothetical protein